MDNTGRLRQPLLPTARRLLFERDLPHQIADELPHIQDVDRAHLVVLMEGGIIDRERGRRLLRAVERLAACHNQPLRGRSASRGLYFLYEDYLIETEGADVAGLLQTGRSRNDLNATVLKLRLRAPYVRLVKESLRLQAVLLRRAARHAGVPMPIYTHGQPAVPVTLGHYWAGAAHAFRRDIEAIFEAASDLRRCPLGACAAGGTTLPVCHARAASLLGFDEPIAHSIDAVASRDIVLRLLAAAAAYGVTASRVASDLLSWTSAELGFITLPDEVVGSSSAMPQKRNPFLLEHVQGRSVAALGAFVTAAGAMHKTPFTNSIAAGTEGVRPLWGGIEATTQVALLLRLVIARARPRAAAMHTRAVEGMTWATALAERLTLERAFDFRTAHREIGAAIAEASADADGEPPMAAVVDALRRHGIVLRDEDLDVARIAARMSAGGGPGAIDATLAALRSDWTAHRRRIRAQVQHWDRARGILAHEVRGLIEEESRAVPQHTM